MTILPFRGPTFRGDMIAFLQWNYILILIPDLTYWTRSSRVFLRFTCGFLRWKANKILFKAMKISTDVSNGPTHGCDWKLHQQYWDLCPNYLPFKYEYKYEYEYKNKSYLILQYISWKLFLHNISSPMRIDRNYKVSLVLSSFPFSHFVTDWMVAWSLHANVGSLAIQCSVSKTFWADFFANEGGERGRRPPLPEIVRSSYRRLQ